MYPGMEMEMGMRVGLCGRPAVGEGLGLVLAGMGTATGLGGGGIPTKGESVGLVLTILFEFPTTKFPSPITPLLAPLALFYDPER